MLDHLTLNFVKETFNSGGTLALSAANKEHKHTHGARLKEDRQDGLRWEGVWKAAKGSRAEAGAEMWLFWGLVRGRRIMQPSVLWLYQSQLLKAQIPIGSLQQSFAVHQPINI